MAANTLYISVAPGYFKSDFVNALLTIKNESFYFPCVLNTINKIHALSPWSAPQSIHQTVGSMLGPLKGKKQWPTIKKLCAELLENSFTSSGNINAPDRYWQLNYQLLCKTLNYVTPTEVIEWYIKSHSLITTFDTQEAMRVELLRASLPNDLITSLLRQHLAICHVAPLELRGRSLCPR